VPSPVAGDDDLVGEALACRRGGRLVFAGLDFRLPAGSALVLTGSNGSGKSSLLRLLATLLTPAEGLLLWEGEPVTTDPARYRAAIGYAGHLDAIKPALTVGETLRFWTALRGAASPPIASRAAASLTVEGALDRFGLTAAADWPCRFLSAGQRRRLALARLVAAPAAIWLLDEPTAALDSDGENRLMTAIAEHRAVGGRIAVATHLPLPLPAAQAIRLDDYAASPYDALASPW
jgi:heme exporter protein A